MFNEVFPILATPDLARSLGFYRDLLGGTVT
jgi:lactoylglutathione lyase